MLPGEEHPITVAVIAPALSMRLGLAAMLANSSHITIVANAANLHDLGYASERFDVLIIAGAATNIPAIEEYFSTNPENLPLPAVLLLLDDPPDSSQLPDPLPLIIRGYLSVESSAEKLVQAVAALAAGLFIIEPAWAARLSRLTTSNFALDNNLLVDLSAREIEVLQHLALGLANKQIGVLLSLSENTVKYHISSIYSKLGAINRAEAVRLGARRGYISL